MALASGQKRTLPISRAGSINPDDASDSRRHNGCRPDAPAQRAVSAAMSWSGASAVLVPVRLSQIRFPSILNSAPREVVGRQARTRVRNGLSGESGRITTLRDEERSKTIALVGSR